MPENRFNLVDEKWIPVANEGLASLADIFAPDSIFTALGGNPVQKIALTKLLLAIAQSAYTPKDDEDWAALGAQGMAEKALLYLREKRDCFWLYGERPFLQMPAIGRAREQSLGAVAVQMATGNTTVLTQSQIERGLSDAEKALLIVEMQNFALGGKKTDNSVVLTEGYTGKTNAKGKPGTGKSGPAIGFLGFLHNFLIGNTIHETVWLNCFTVEQISTLPTIAIIGKAPWEEMPAGEDCAVAKKLKQTYIGRLVPVCRFVLLGETGVYYSEGIHYPGYLEGGFDLSTGVDFSATRPRALWVNTEKRPWRQIVSLLSFLSSRNNNAMVCYQLRYCIPRTKGKINALGVWSGGLSVSSNAGEQFASGNDDYLESEVYFKSSFLDAKWLLCLQGEMKLLEDLSQKVFACVSGYYRCQLMDGNEIAAQASNLYWQLAEHLFQELVNACGNNNSEKMRPMFADIAIKVFNTYCPRDTARQLDAWAKCRPQLGRYYVRREITETAPQTI